MALLARADRRRACASARSGWSQTRRLLVAIGVWLMVDTAAALDVGDSLPVVELQDWQGTNLQLGPSTPGIVLVDFWASWCIPCRTLLPALSRVAQRLPKARVVAVNVDADRSEADALLSVVGPLPGLTLARDPSARVMADFGAPSMPALFVFVDGRLRSVHGGFSTSEVEKLGEELRGQGGEGSH